MNAVSHLPAPSTASPAPASSMAKDANGRPLPRCKCGTDRTCRTASPEREYTLGGAAYLLWGGTSIPKRVNFRCIFCGVVFDSLSSRPDCRKYIT